MSKRPPYRPGQISPTQAAQAFAERLAIQLEGYRANIARYTVAHGWSKGYHIAPATYASAIDGTGAALVRYIPAPVKSLQHAWGDKRNPALDLTQDAALAAAAVKLQKDGWDCTLTTDTGPAGSYLPALIVRKGDLAL